MAISGVFACIIYTGKCYFEYMQIWSPSPILTNVDFQYVILGTFLKCLVVKKSVAISGRYIHIKTGLIRQCTKLKFGKKFFHRNLSGRVQKQQEMLILSKQAITFDIMATEIFFIHRDIGLKFVEHVLQINNYKITGGFDCLVLFLSRAQHRGRFTQNQGI